MTAPSDQEMLDAVRERMHVLVVGGAVKSYGIAQRTIERYSLTELMALESRLAARVRAGASRDRVVSFGEPE